LGVFDNSQVPDFFVRGIKFSSSMDPCCMESGNVEIDLHEDNLPSAEGRTQEVIDVFDYNMLRALQDRVQYSDKLLSRYGYDWKREHIRGNIRTNSTDSPPRWIRFSYPCLRLLL
jgi:hypothetical protein